MRKIKADYKDCKTEIDKGNFTVCGLNRIMKKKNWNRMERQTSTDENILISTSRTIIFLLLRK